MTDLDSGHEIPEMLQIYFNRSWDLATRTQDFKEWTLDEIPKDLVACIELGDLRRFARDRRRGREEITDQPFFAALDYLLEKAHRVEERPVTSPLSVGIPKWFRPHVLEAVDAGLLSPFKGKTRARCGLFGVPKKDTLRVIFDARPANQHLKPLPAELRIFALEELLKAIGEIASFGTFTTLNIDSRHYYYQIRIPDAWRRFFVVELDGLKYAPRALPMGYRDACVLAQIITWLIVFYTEDGEDDLGLDPAELRQRLMPRFVRLRDKEGRTVGFIFVLLDGIFGVFRTPHLARRWDARLQRTEKRFNVWRKDQGATVKTPNTTDWTTFAGVQVANSEKAPGLAVVRPDTLDLQEKLPATATDRQIAAACGSALWGLRIAEAAERVRRTCTASILLEHEDLMLAWSHAVRHAKERDSWDTPAQDIRRSWAAIERVKQRLFEKGGPCWHTVRAAQECQACITLATRLATDATPTHVGFVIYSRFVPGKPEIAFGMKLPRRMEQIGAETQALLIGVEAGAGKRDFGVQPMRCGHCGGEPWTIAAVDADGLRYAVEKGYSSAPWMRDYLRAIFAVHTNLRVVRVPGADNAADATSRMRPLDERAVRETWNRLQQ